MALPPRAARLYAGRFAHKGPCLMQTLCPECDAGPQGNAGHAGLEILPRSVVGDAQARFILQCRDCSARWVREFSKDGPSWMLVQ